MILRPLLGYRPVAACTEDELRGLFLSGVTLHPPGSASANPYVETEEAERYATELAAVVRQKVPATEHIAPQHTGQRNTVGVDS